MPPAPLRDSFTGPQTPHAAGQSSFSAIVEMSSRRPNAPIPAARASFSSSDVWAGAASLAIISGHIGWHLPFLGSPEAHDFHHSLNGGRNLDNLGQVDVLDRVLHTNKEFLKSWQYTVHKGYTTPDYPVDKALATTEKPLPA